jgi:dinuclear metal center YbgI/SA1388 family protein
MVFIYDVIRFLNHVSHPSLQEAYDNCGLLTGMADWECRGILCSLDVTEEVLDECKHTGANLIVAHHPLIFKPLKNLSSQRYPQPILRKAIKEDIAIFAIHTNYDNVIEGVNHALAEKIGLKINELSILEPQKRKIAKLFTYVPFSHKEQVRDAIFKAGGGEIGNYAECSFETAGTGTFRPSEKSNPFIGKSGGPRENAEEVKLEIILPVWKQSEIINALKESHPYEEVAYEIIVTENEHQQIGAGVIGYLPSPVATASFLAKLKEKLGIPYLRHNTSSISEVRKVALCGGAGAFLTQKAIQAGADVFVTADLKYHDFFEADGKILLLDAGHYETEIAAIAQLVKDLQKNFPTFAVLQTEVNTNSVKYF